MDCNIISTHISYMTSFGGYDPQVENQCDCREHKVAHCSSVCSASIGNGVTFLGCTDRSLAC